MLELKALLLALLINLAITLYTIYVLYHKAKTTNDRYLLMLGITVHQLFSIISCIVVESFVKYRDGEGGAVVYRFCDKYFMHGLLCCCRFERVYMGRTYGRGLMRLALFAFYIPILLSIAGNTAVILLDHFTGESMVKYNFAISIASFPIPILYLFFLQNIIFTLMYTTKIFIGLDRKDYLKETKL